MRGAVAEELPQRLLVIADAVLLDQRDDVGGREARQRRLGEVRVLGEKVFGAAVDVGEVAAAAAGDQDLLADALGVVEQDDAPSAPPGLDGAHHARRACAQHHHIYLLHDALPSLSSFASVRVRRGDAPPVRP